MTRIPVVGGDVGTWGTVLNDFLEATLPTHFALNGATSIGATSITLDREPMPFVATGGVLVIDAYSSDAEVRPVASIAGSVVTLVNAETFASSAVTFTAITRKIAATNIAVKLLPGMKFTITGSVSNNGIYTVEGIPGTVGDNAGTNDERLAYIIVSEAVVEEAPGASVTMKVDLESAHADGAIVAWLPGGLIPAELYGIEIADTAVAAINARQFQRCSNNYYSFSTYFGGLQLPTGRVFIGGKILLCHGQKVSGAGVDGSIVEANGAITFIDDDDAIFGVHNGGLVASRLSRVYLSDFVLSGGNISGANGIRCTLQQPCHWDSFRVIDCPGYGIKMGGQQWIAYNLEITNCGIGFVSDGMEFAWIRGFNVEQSATYDFMGNGFFNHIIDIHLESLCATSFKVTGGFGWIFENVWHSNPSTGTGFLIDGVDGQGAATDFQIKQFRANANSVTYLMVNDVARGISRTSAQCNRTIIRIVSGIYNKTGIRTPIAWAEEVTGLGSGDDGLGVGTGYDLPPHFGTGIGLMKSTTLNGNLFGGNGAPVATYGGVGDFYLRYDTPSTANQRLYVKTAVSTWTGIL